ncbi:MAG: nucleotidyltransferase family protein [Gemmatimonadota bacterium]|nr:MAG: nucleotidyltransferase family protein [Gemmatimonadota bacterium]
MAEPARRGLGWLEPALEVLGRRYFRPESGGRDWSARDWARAVGGALVERLGPALSEAAAACSVELPRVCWAALAAARLDNERRLEAHRRALAELAPALEARGIATVLFKGLATARHYPVASVREADDVDLLVMPEHLAGAEASLRELGYRVWAGGGRLSSRYALAYAREPGNGEEVELDLHPSWHEVRLAGDGEHVLVGDTCERVLRIELDGTEWSVLPPSVELYLAAAHTVLHSFRTLSVYLDLSVLLAAAGPDALDYAGKLARAMGRQRHLRHGVSVAIDLFQLEVDTEYKSLPRRLGVPLAVRVGYLGFGRRFLPSSLVMELLLRRGLQQKLAFARWVLGHKPQEAEGTHVAGRRPKRLLRGLRWLKGTLLRYQIPGSVPLRP